MELLIIMGCILIILLVFAFFKIRHKKYIDFLKSNSIALNSLLKINKNYNFYVNVKSFGESHTYDNEIFYNIISCEDYLIYQLQFQKYAVEKEQEKISRNREEFKKYRMEISNINEFGRYTVTNNRLSKKNLLIIERKLFLKNILEPVINFNIRIYLCCSKINGVIYRRKTQNFTSAEITSLIKRLKNKDRNFYNDKGIWDAICRVERGKVSNKMRFSIYRRDGYRCRKCSRSERSDYLEIDHIKPIAKGGKSTYDNLQTLCRRCNKYKGDTY